MCRYGGGSLVTTPATMHYFSFRGESHSQDQSYGGIRIWCGPSSDILRLPVYCACIVWVTSDLVFLRHRRIETPTDLLLR